MEDPGPEVSGHGRARGAVVFSEALAGSSGRSSDRDAAPAASPATPRPAAPAAAVRQPGPGSVGRSVGASPVLTVVVPGSSFVGAAEPTGA